MSTRFLLAVLVAVLAGTIVAHTSQIAFAQNATGTTNNNNGGGRHHFGGGGHDFVGLGGGVIGLPHFRIHGLGQLPGATATVVSGGTTVVAGTGTHEHHAGFANYVSFARQHHNHFVWLNNRFIVLNACPPGTIATDTGECAVQSVTILQQAAPTIISQAVTDPSDPAITVVAPPAPTASAPEDQSTTTVTTSTTPPIVTCPPGSNMVDGQCQITTSQTQIVAPNVACQPGSSLQNGQCVEQQQQIVVDPLPCPQCPVGSNLQGGQCIVSALPSQVIVSNGDATTGQLVILGHTFHHNGLLPFLNH